MSGQDLNDAIKSINQSASLANATSDFFEKVIAGDKYTTVKNPVDGSDAPTVQKMVYDQYSKDINQIQQDVTDSEAAANRAEAAAGVVGPQVRESIRRSYLDSGLSLVSGSFSAGAKVELRTDVVIDSQSGKVYAWKGAIPSGGKIIPAGSTPESSGGIGDNAWVDVSDVTSLSITHYATASDMISEASISGIIAATSGYYSPADGGGGMYYISQSDPGYGIPTSKGLFAVLCDDFDIRKFGIISSPTLDQSDSIKIMSKCADAIGEYEIDFHNFNLMTPTTLHFTTGRNAQIRGMGFNKPHKIKNLIIANNKSVQLVSGTSPILFLPKDPAGVGEFSLENVTFDPYVANYLIVSGEGDGMMFGFHAMWHPEAGQSWPASSRFLTGYSFSFSNINFLSPAVSYNLSCHDFFSKRITASDLRGDYWGIYLVHHTETLIAADVNGIFRNDLHTPSGRLLVTNLIHEESEIADDGVITRKLVSIDDSSCYKKSGEIHTVYKCHRIGTVTINEILVKNCDGKIEIYGGDTDANRKRLVVKSLSITDGNDLYFSPNAQINSAELSGFKSIKTPVLYNTSYGDLLISDIDSLDSTLANGVATANKVTLRRIGAVKDQTFGIVRSQAKVGEFILDDVECNSPKCIDCDFGKITATGLSVDIPSDLNNFFSNQSSPSAFPPIDISISNSDIVTTGGGLALTSTPSGASLKVRNSRMIGVAYNFIPSLGDGVLSQRKVSVQAATIDAGATRAVNVSIDGAKVGDVVRASFNSYNPSIEWSSVVTAANTVSLIAKNTSSASVSVPAGIAKIIVQS
ncbi:MAG: hypothetical protein ACRC8W_03115 [Plesiomonas shigelloides]